MEMKTWHGERPIRCEICGQTFPTDRFVDARTVHGLWGVLCERCHRVVGIGFGAGKGQLYSLTTLEKLAG